MSSEQIIELDDRTKKILVYQYGLDDEEENLPVVGAKLRVREEQAAAFLVNGKLAEVAEEAGTYSLDRSAFPLVAALKGFPTRQGAPVRADLYFLSKTALYENKWATQTPVLKSDPILGMMRVRAYGKFDFRIVNCYDFMVEMVESRRVTTTYDVGRYLASVIAGAFAAEVSDPSRTLRSLMQGRNLLAEAVLKRAAKTLEFTGIELLKIEIEGLSLPEEVQESFERSAADRADEVWKEQAVYRDETMMKYRRLRELKSLYDDKILTQEEYEAEKAKLLSY